MILSFGQMICRAVFSKQYTGCGHNGITLHSNKFQFGQDTVTFAGCEITVDHVKPHQKLIEPIANFPMFTNIHNICSYLDLINQVSYASAASEKLQPL